MIITLKGANFSANKIGTLTTWTIRTSYSSSAVSVTSGSIPTSLDRTSNSGIQATLTIQEGYELGATGVTVTMGGNPVTSGITVSGNTITISIASVTGNVVITVPTKNTATGEEDDGDNSGSGDSDLGTTFTLTSDMLKNQTYSSTEGAYKASNVHLATDFIELKAGYDVVFDLPDDWNGYVAHVAKNKGASGTYVPLSTSVLSGWVTKGTVSTGATLDKYLIVLQKTNKSAITPSDYAAIEGSVQVKLPSARTVTLDSSLMNAKKGYSELNLTTQEGRICSWFYALTPGSTVKGNVASGLQAYIVSIRDGETKFSVDTDWVTSFDKTYDKACSILIVAKKTDGTTFTDTSDWTSPITIDIK